VKGQKHDRFENGALHVNHVCALFSKAGQWAPNAVRAFHFGPSGRKVHKPIRKRELRSMVSSSRAIISADDLRQLAFMRIQVLYSTQDPRTETAATRIWHCLTVSITGLCQLKKSGSFILIPGTLSWDAATPIEHLKSSRTTEILWISVRTWTPRRPPDCHQTC
jgi:hypothetical protein